MRYDEYQTNPNFPISQFHHQLTMADTMLILLIAILMLILILIIIILTCKPWRWFSTRPIKVDELERPLISENQDLVENQGNGTSVNYAPEGACHHSQGHINSPRTHDPAFEHKFPPTTPQLTHSDSFVLDISDHSEDIYVGQRLRHTVVTNSLTEDQKLSKKEDSCCELRLAAEDNKSAGSILALEVISGPSHGLRSSIKSTNASRLPLTLGRVSPSDIVVNDSEVSGKHAMINWNLNMLKWELVDMGSLNGTLLNSVEVHHPRSRQQGDPIQLANGDIITLGTTSKIIVHITSQTEQVPFGVGVASDPMSMRRGTKKLPMEDVCYFQWPLPGTDQFGLFGICDGHGGTGAAISTSKIMPETVASILSDSFRKEKVLSQCDASDVLREAFSLTEECLDHYYEGCTATALLVWADGNENFFAQCANVGDSACVANIDGKQINMTEDHRIISQSERLRIQTIGEPLKDGQTRLCGLNLARMLGDKFLKQQDARFSSEPYISQVVNIHQGSRGFALIASDGFWDVVSPKKAVQLVDQSREKNNMDGDNSANKVANFLLSEARTRRTKDNTSIIFLDFDTTSRNVSCN